MNIETALQSGQPFQAIALEDNNLSNIITFAPNGMGYWFIERRGVGGCEELKRPISTAGIVLTLSFWGLSKESDAYTTTLHKRGIPVKQSTPVVYFVQGSITKHVKIGYASCIESRLAGLKGGCSEPLSLLHTISNGSVALERQWHKKCAKYRLHGEWFSPEVLTILRSKLQFEDAQAVAIELANHLEQYD